MAKWDPLNEAQLALCPHGRPNCRLCQFPADIQQELQNKKFKEKFTYAQMRELLRTTYHLKIDFTELNNHFNKHVLGQHVLEQILERKGQIKYPEVTKALVPISTEIKVITSKELEKAYATLVKMSEGFVKDVKKLQEKISLTIETRAENKELDDEFNRVSALDLMEKLGKLNKESREFVKEVSALRAPKVMVAQFLESFIDDVLREMSELISNLCGALQFDITNELTELKHPNILSAETFANIFKKTALDFRDRMINLKRQQLSDAMVALQDLEKII